jgi:hypothetical protein
LLPFDVITRCGSETSVPLVEQKEMTMLHYLRQNIDVPPTLFPPSSDFNFEWRRALRSKGYDRQRQRICQLRANARNRSSAGKPSMGHVIIRVAEIIELNAREGWLGLQKILLKIRRVFR